MPARILVCIDGERHSHAAIDHAISLGLSTQAEVTALHVIDPYLKQFYNEIYAQGRKAYLDYMDQSLRDLANTATEEFTRRCKSHGLEASVRTRQGEPLEEILAELTETSPDLLITGGKRLGPWGRFRSRNLPNQIRKEADVAQPLRTVRETLRA